MRVVFDLDGTLVDSTPDLLAAINQVLGTHHLELSNREENQRLAGHGLHTMFASTIRARVPDWEESKQQALVSEILDQYSTHPARYTVAYQGITEMLETLQKQHIELCIISNKLSSLTKQVLATIFPSISFLTVYGSDSGFPLKPDPTSLKRCMLGMQADESLIFVGDTEVDYETAKGTADAVYLATWGYRNKQALLSYGIHEDLLLESPMHLVRMVALHKERKE